MTNLKKLFLILSLISASSFLTSYSMENKEQCYQKFVQFMCEDTKTFCKKATTDNLKKIAKEKSAEVLKAKNENHVSILKYIFFDLVFLKKFEAEENLFKKIFFDKKISTEIKNAYFDLSFEMINDLNLSIDKIKSNIDISSNLFIVLFQTSLLIKKTTFSKIL